ncbi:hypothetical protein BH11BAC1_BH11BAC1_05800 [soil metagenome]
MICKNSSLNSSPLIPSIASLVIMKGAIDDNGGLKNSSKRCCYILAESDFLNSLHFKMRKNNPCNHQNIKSNYHNQLYESMSFTYKQNEHQPLKCFETYSVALQTSFGSFAFLKSPFIALSP